MVGSPNIVSTIPVHHWLRAASRGNSPLDLCLSIYKCPICFRSQTITLGREQRVLVVNSPPACRGDRQVIRVHMVCALQGLTHISFLWCCVDILTIQAFIIDQYS